MSARTRLLTAALASAVVTAGVLRLRDALQVARAERRTIHGEDDRSGAAVPLARDLRVPGPVADTHLVARPGEPDWVVALAGWVPPPPRTPGGQAFAMAWAGPVTLAGLLLGALGGGAPVVRDGVLVFEHVGGPAGWMLRTRGFAATTLGHVVLAKASPSAALMAHELAHTRQAERLGPLMAPIYWWLLGRYGYARHPMERAARIAGRAAREAATKAAAKAAQPPS